MPALVVVRVAQPAAFQARHEVSVCTDHKKIILDLQRSTCLVIEGRLRRRREGSEKVGRGGAPAGQVTCSVLGRRCRCQVAAWRLALPCGRGGRRRGLKPESDKAREFECHRENQRASVGSPPLMKEPARSSASAWGLAADPAGPTRPRPTPDPSRARSQNPGPATLSPSLNPTSTRPIATPPPAHVAHPPHSFNLAMTSPTPTSHHPVPNLSPQARAPSYVFSWTRNSDKPLLPLPPASAFIGA